MEVSNFNEKLNKVEGKVYVIEEKIQIPESGVYEALLRHDNVNISTLTVYTGPQLTGEQIQTFVLTTPSLTPWKRVIRIQANAPVVYVCYETDGDTVEADDVNSLQCELIRTQQGVSAEEERAEAAETELNRRLVEEVARAKGREEELTRDLVNEVHRATGAEGFLTQELDKEIERAKAAEQTNANAVDTERARAEAAEKKIAGDLAAETSRAEAAEQSNAAAVSAERARALEAEDALRRTIDTNSPIWNDKYTKNEIDNKFSALETAIDWKESVGSYDDIATAYPEPQDGWTVNVNDTDITYRWNGSKWIPISANSIPKATSSVDGILCKEDKVTYDDAAAKRHTHENKSALDMITHSLLDNWDAAHSHLSKKDNPHGVTKEQVGLGNVPNVATNDQAPTFSEAATSAKLVSGEKLSASLGKIAKTISEWLVHKADVSGHVSASDRNEWSDANAKKHTHTNKTILDKVTQAMLDKLAGIAAGAEVNVQSDWKVTDNAADAYIKNKPTSMPASDVPAWAKAANKPTYNWTEIDGRPGTYPPAGHTHSKSQITDMPTKVSQFINDAGYITAGDVDTSQNHVHTNKIILDKVTQAMLDKLAGIAAGANKYIHPVTPGNKHIPAGGKTGQILKWHADGEAEWGEETKTTYTHPSSGVAAGTYKSVTVNAQGHVTGGSNPTTLAGYGITDAATKSHNHDGVYIKKGTVTWDDLGGG